MSRRVFLDKKIELDLIDCGFYIRPGKKIFPIRVEAREECQVNSPQEKKQEKYSKENVHKTNIAHKKLGYSLSLGYRKWISNIESVSYTHLTLPTIYSV